MISPESNIDAPRSVVLLLHCPLRLGLATTLTQFVYNNNGRILYHDQYVDSESNHYYTRLKWDITNFALSNEEIEESLRNMLANGTDMEWKLHYSDDVVRMAVLVSKDPWCLYDILAHWQSGEWDIEIPIIIGNHPDLEPVANKFGIEFHVL